MTNTFTILTETLHLLNKLLRLVKASSVTTEQSPLLATIDINSTCLMGGATQGVDLIIYSNIYDLIQSIKTDNFLLSMFYTFIKMQNFFAATTVKKIIPKT